MNSIYNILSNYYKKPLELIINLYDIKYYKYYLINNKTRIYYKNYDNMNIIYIR